MIIIIISSSSVIIIIIIIIIIIQKLNWQPSRKLVIFTRGLCLPKYEWIIII